MQSEIVENVKNGKTKEAINTFSKKGKEMGIKARDNLIANIVKNPLRSIGIAAVTGCVAAFLLKKKQQQSK